MLFLGGRRAGHCHMRQWKWAQGSKAPEMTLCRSRTSAAQPCRNTRLSPFAIHVQDQWFRDTLYCAGSYCVDAWPPLQSHGTLHVIIEPCLEPSIIYNSPWPRTAPRPPTRRLQLSVARSRRERLQLHQRGSRFFAVRSPWICRF